MMTLVGVFGTVGLIEWGIKYKSTQEGVDKISKAREALIATSNFSLARNSTLTIGGVASESLNEVTVNNKMQDGYIASSVVEEGKSKIYSETLIFDGTSYLKGKELEEWTDIGPNTLKSVVGISEILNLDIEAKDCKEIKKSTDGDNEIVSIVTSSRYLKKFKDKYVEKLLNESPINSNDPENVEESTKEFLEIMEKINYVSIDYKFIIDKSGVLVGTKVAYAIEMPSMDFESDGKVKYGKHMVNIASTSNIKIKSYNNSKNEDIIKGLMDDIGDSSVIYKAHRFI